MKPPRSRLAISAVIASILIVGCVPTGQRPELVDAEPPVEAGPPDLSGIECPEAGDQFAAFAVAPIAMVDGQGHLVQCVLVADTPELRQRGLSGVADLGGHAGMIFAFPEDTTGSFWMGNTHVPLTIAFIDSAGTPVTVLDMEPCPEAVDCPSYFPDTPYRWALEVPQGQMEQFGLADGVVLHPATLPPAHS